PESLCEQDALWFRTTVRERPQCELPSTGLWIEQLVIVCSARLGYRRHIELLERSAHSRARIHEQLEHSAVPRLDVRQPCPWSVAILKGSELPLHRPHEGSRTEPCRMDQPSG